MRCIHWCNIGLKSFTNSCNLLCKNCMVKRCTSLQDKNKGSYFKLKSYDHFNLKDCHVNKTIHILGFPTILRAIFVSFLAGVWLFITLLYLRRYILRSLLAYRGWLCKYTFLYPCRLLILVRNLFV